MCLVKGELHEAIRYCSQSPLGGHRRNLNIKVSFKPGGMTPSSTACPPGLHGPLCQLQCDCVNGASCHPASGRCSCPPGYHGARCHRGRSNRCRLLQCGNRITAVNLGLRMSRPLSVCEQGTFGFSCAQVCECEDGAPCDPVTGSCLCSSGKTGPRCDIGKLLSSL